jgi:hypothetical protein
MIHHPGHCHGGPYAGMWRNYFEPIMPVFVAAAVGESGWYEWHGEPGKEGVWVWHPLRGRE